MNIAIFNGKVSMTSVEIAELVGKRHDNVKRTIETLAKGGVVRSPQIEVSERINNLGFKVQYEQFVSRNGSLRWKKKSATLLKQSSKLKRALFVRAMPDIAN